MLGFLKQWRRRRVLARERISDRDWELALRHVPSAHALTEDGRRRLRDLVVLFLHEKHVSGAGGLELTDEMRHVIAVQACLPILELGLDAYRRFESVYVYPTAFRADEMSSDEHGIVTHDRGPRAGEAWLGGPVVVSWEDSHRGGRWPEDGVNVVIHEFAHKLDMLDGAANGVPPLHSEQDAGAWQRDFQSAFERFCDRVDRGEDTALDPYGAESPAEFFAVCSEAFFETPEALAHEWPSVYDHLAAFYRQDPRRRSATDSLDSRRPRE